MIIQAQSSAAAPLSEVAGRIVRQLTRRGLDSAATTSIADTQPVLIRAGVAGVTKQVAVQSLPPAYHEDRVVIPIRWIATGVGGDLFPTLEANLDLRAESAESTAVTLVGSYEPPFGRPGAVLDHFVMHRLAERTLQHFVDRLAVLVTSPKALEPDVA